MMYSKRLNYEIKKNNLKLLLFLQTGDRNEVYKE